MPITVVSDNSFIIKRPFDQRLKPVDDISRIGCKWKVGLSTFTANAPFLFLHCTFNDSKLWNINAHLTFTINKDNGESKNVEMKKEARFSSEESHTTLKISLDDCEEVTSIECLVEIKSSTGIHYQTPAFDKKTVVNDTALIVEGKELYVSKQILSNASPVFYAMFYSGFKESGAEKVAIGDVKYNDMEQFLSLIYGQFEITGSNIDSLLKLANCYDVRVVTQKCEEYLIKAKDVSKAAKLIYAEDYFLSKLQCEVLKSLTLEELKDFGLNSSKFGEATVKELYRLSVPHMGLETTARMKSAKPKGTIRPLGGYDTSDFDSESWREDSE